MSRATRAAARLPLLGLIFALALPAAAQVTDPATDIRADAGALSLGTNVSRAASTITIDGGTAAGANLFHSFSNFDLNSADTARWVRSGGDGASFASVVSRVTGGSPSAIFGSLDSTALPNADFYFINPAGIVFGATASINVPAAAHFSTASQLNFGDGTSFAVTTPGGSTFSMSAPESFGFLGGEGAIAISGGGGATVLPAAVSLTASDILLDDIDVQGGSIALSAVGGGEATIFLDGSSDRFLSGAIELADSLLVTDGQVTPDAAGFISLNGGTVTSNSVIATLAGDTTDGGDIFIGADNIRLLDQGRITGQTSRAGNAGAIRIDAASFVADPGSLIDSQSTGPGNSGDVAINATTALLNGSSVTSSSVAGGLAGNVTISAGSMIASGTFIGSTPTIAGSAGNVRINASEVVIRDGSVIATDTSNANPAGSILIETPELKVTDSQISSSSSGPGDAGNIVLRAGDITLGNAAIASSSSCFTDGCVTGNAGNIDIGAGSLTMIDSTIDTDTFGAGQGGGILISVGAFRSVGGGVTSDTVGAGNAGAVGIFADSIEAQDTGFFAGSFGSGSPGNVFLGARTISLLGVSLGAQPSGGGNPAGGLAGAVSITAIEDLLIDSSFITTLAFGNANAGNVDLRAGGLLAVTDSFLTSGVTPGCADAGCTRFTGGAAGVISLAGGNIVVDRSTFNTDTVDLGGGFITINADSNLLVTDSQFNSDSQGAGRAGGVGLNGLGSVTITRALVSSEALASGGAGDISVISLGDTILIDSDLSSDAFVVGATGGGAAGSVTVFGNNVSLLRGSFTTDTVDGNGGNVTVRAEGLLDLTETMLASDTFGSGLAGGVTLFGGSDVTITDSAISSDSVGEGAAGFVDISSNTGIFVEGASLSSTGFGDGDAGFLSLAAPFVFLTDGSSLSLDARGTGAAGFVGLLASEGLLIDNSRVSAQTNAAFGDRAGNILIGGGIGDDGLISGSRMIIRNGSTVQANTVGSARGGDILVFIDDVEVRDSVVTSDSCPDGCADGGNAGGIQFNSDSLLVVSEAGRATISSNTNSQGAAGSVSIQRLGDVRPVSVEVSGQQASVSSDTGNAGAAGFVFVEADTVSINNGGRISSEAQIGATGAPGNVTVTAGQLLISNDETVPTDEFGLVRSISTSTAGPGSGGTIFIDAGLLRITGGAIIAGTSYAGTAGDGLGAGGNIDIEANNLDVAGDAFTRSVISAGSLGTGDGGDVLISATDTIRVASSGSISSNTEGSGFGGDVELSAARVIVESGGSISADTAFLCGFGGCGGLGGGGSVAIDAGTVNVTGGGALEVLTFISADALGDADAGDVTINANAVNVQNGAFISSQAFGSSGDAGLVSVGADTILVSTGGYISSDARVSTGDAGTVLVNANAITVETGGAIQSRSIIADPDLGLNGQASGDAGSIFVTAGTINARSGGHISSSTETSGAAGSVDIEATTVTLDGGSINSGSAIAPADRNPDGIVASGASGDIALRTADLFVRGAGSIETNSVNANSAGSITVTTERMTIAGVGSEISSSNSGSGSAGAITVNQTSTGFREGIRLSEGGRIVTSAAVGPAGDIVLNMTPSSFLFLESRGVPSRINTDSPVGTAGRVSIASPFAIILNGGSITALGQTGALLTVETEYFIRSSDRFNQVLVNQGSQVDLGEYDVSAGLLNRELSPIDASGVLRGQCPVQRSTGQLSQFSVRAVGPYAQPAAEPEPPRPDEGTASLQPRLTDGACL